MHKDVVTEAELQTLLGDGGAESAGPGAELPPLAGDDRKLLHALVRNQLRLLHMIEELQSELHKLKYEETRGPAARETAAGLEPLPLPFMKKPAAEQAGAAEPEDETAPLSRKERFKRKPLW